MCDASTREAVRSYDGHNSSTERCIQAYVFLPALARAPVGFYAVCVPRSQPAKLGCMRCEDGAQENGYLESAERLRSCE